MDRRVRSSIAILFILTTGAGNGAPAIAQESPPQVLAPSRTFSTSPFSRIRGVQELPDGRALVADQREEALYRVDFESQERTLLGKRGGGPGEYRTPTSLYPFRGDSILLVDVQNGRFAVVSPEGEIGRTEPLFGPDVSIPEAADRMGNRYWDRVTNIRTAKRQNPDTTQAPILRLEYETGRIDTLGYLTIPGPPNPNALPAWDDWAVSPEGRVAIVRNQDAYRLDWVFPDGTFQAGSPVSGFQAIRVTRADRTALDERPGGGRGGSFSTGSQSPSRPPPPAVPDRFPPAKLGRIWVTHDGRCIVERHQHLSERRPLFDLFGSDGTRESGFRLPMDRRIVGTGRSGIYAVREDDVGFLWLEVYELPGR